MWFLAYKSPFLQGTYTFLRFSDLLTPIGVTSFNLGPGTVFSYNDLWMILSQLTVITDAFVHEIREKMLTSKGISFVTGDRHHFQSCGVQAEASTAHN